MRAHMRTHTLSLTHTHTHTHTRTLSTHRGGSGVKMRKHTPAHTLINTHTHTYTHIHTRTYTHVRTSNDVLNTVRGNFLVPHECDVYACIQCTNIHVYTCMCSACVCINSECMLKNLPLCTRKTPKSTEFDPPLGTLVRNQSTRCAGSYPSIRDRLGQTLLSLAGPVAH